MKNKLLNKIYYYPFLKENLHLITESPGIYIYTDINKNVIYVGKAKSLRNRISSYFNKNIFGKTDKLVKNIKYMSTIKVESELEAILLEAKLIRLFMPYFNVALKDDKGPYFVYITKDKYPRVVIDHKPPEGVKIKKIYGPFNYIRKLNYILKTFRRIVPFSTHKPSKKICFYRQIGYCNPCPSEIENEKDQKKQKQLLKIFKTNIRYTILLFEGRFKKLVSDLKKEMRLFAKTEEFEKAEIIKRKIEMLFEITSPLNKPEDYMEDPYYIKKVRWNEISEFNKLLKVYFENINVKRIECYDISHIQGSNSAGSMVTFINTKERKDYYRHFRLRRSFNSDTGSLLEIAKRRVNHLNDWGVPDLLLIDGGKGQVNTFKKVFDNFNIPVIGIAKRNEKLIIPTLKGFDEISVKGNVLNLVQRLRNEAHRFAQRYHHKLVKQQLFENDNINK